jgi:hypothetical protein
LVEELPAVLW